MDNNKLLEIFGTDELVKMFNDLQVDVKTKILTTSFKKASLIIINDATGNLGAGFRHIKASFGTKFRKEENALYVGSFKKKGGGFSHIVNSGTKERFYTTKGGSIHKTGKIIANHFWDKALLESENKVENAIYEDIRKRFNDYINKSNKIKK